MSLNQVRSGGRKLTMQWKFLSSSRGVYRWAAGKYGLRLDTRQRDKRWTLTFNGHEIAHAGSNAEQCKAAAWRHAIGQMEAAAASSPLVPAPSAPASTPAPPPAEYACGLCGSEGVELRKNGQGICHAADCPGRGKLYPLCPSPAAIERARRPIRDAGLGRIIRDDLHETRA